MASIEVRGAEKLTRVADVLAAHGDGKSLKSKMRRAFRDEAAVVTKEQRASLAAGLPHRGGLAATVASEGRMTIRTALASRSVGVTLVDSWRGHDMQGIDAGTIRHPLFGDRGHWYSQRVPTLMLTKPFLRRRRPIQRAIIRSLDALAVEIAKET